MSDSIEDQIAIKISRLITEMSEAQKRKNFNAFPGFVEPFEEIDKLCKEHYKENKKLMTLLESEPQIQIYGGSLERNSANLSVLKSRLQLMGDILGIKANQSKKETENNMQSKNPRDVFVVHGRNLRARDGLFAFLRSINLNPLEWSSLVEETGDPTPYIGEILDVAFTKAQAVIVLMTPDDEGKLRDEFLADNEPPHEKNFTPQARLNVLFEAGMAMGRFPKRTILVELGDLRPFSDIGGRHVLKMNNSSTKRQELAQRLKTANCEVNISGTDWHTAGSFE